MIKRREDTRGADCDDSILVLREDQVGVLDAALAYIHQAKKRMRNEPPFGRIILPPRTGKTIIAATIAARDGRPTVFLAPTKVLVEQAAAVFRSHLPTTPVWVIAGASRDVGDQGIVVATYQSLGNLFKTGQVPPLVHNAALVFADEAHHAMTEIRQGTLRKAFEPHAVRIALTATPDYDEERILARHFPDLIHEMTIQEGVQMDLLAPVRATAAEVDAGASHVRIQAGDYSQEDIGHVMARAPLLKAIEAFRYAEEYTNVPALICCTTRAQAMAVFEYLAEHRPQGTPCPVPVLGDMDDRMRQRFLHQYEEGELDTLITVGVLVEGWSSPRCKLLIDAAPSLSMVRASQKFTRVMTKDNEREARIVMLIPAGLTYLPIMPFDVFGPALEEEELRTSRRQVGNREPPQHSSPWQRLRESGIRISSIQVNLRILLDLSVAKIPTIKNVRTIRQIISRFFGKPDARMTTYGRFMATPFRIGEVVIRGGQLLRFLGFSSHISGYIRFLQRYYPKVAADRLLAAYGHARKTKVERVETFKNRRLDVLRSLGIKGGSDLIPTQESYADKAWLSTLERPSGLLLGIEPSRCWPIGREGEDLLPPDDFRPKAEPLLARMAEVLTPMDMRILKWRFGLEDGRGVTLKEIGKKCDLCGESIRRHVENAIRSLKGASWWRPKDEAHTDWNKRLNSETLEPILTTQWTSKPVDGLTVLTKPPWIDHLDFEEFLASGAAKELSQVRHPCGKPLWLCWHDRERDWMDCSDFFLEPLKAWLSKDEGSVQQVHVLVQRGNSKAIYSRSTK